MTPDWTADLAGREALVKARRPSITIGRNSQETRALTDHALICLSHLRWDFVFQRPQHLMSRFAAMMPVYFVEEPIFEGDAAPELLHRRTAERLTVLVPRLPARMPSAEAARHQKKLLGEFLSRAGIVSPVLWFYTPMALEFIPEVPAAVVIYDCMDELSAFKDASSELRRFEAELLGRADIVFTGGISLYEAKHGRHSNVHAFPSAVDVPHFAQARRSCTDPSDQIDTPRPRLGFFGVIDERLDRGLVAAVAQTRSDWQLIFIGPVVKIDPETLPQLPNVHYLGRKNYADLPGYIAHWDAAMMPFALNEATRFISPTKTPEYLAAGKPVISTPIVDVVHSWGHLDAVRIAGSPTDFIKEAAAALSLAEGAPNWLEPVDRLLAEMSWDRTWSQMVELIEVALAHNARLSFRSAAWLANPGAPRV
jgi:UDP-galactopyranose mutase